MKTSCQMSQLNTDRLRCSWQWEEKKEHDICIHFNWANIAQYELWVLSNVTIAAV